MSSYFHTTAGERVHLLQLPDAPPSLAGPVKIWREPVQMLTYAPEPADRNPMFLEKRVYQGSSGRVYPLPFIDRIASEPAELRWDAIHLENEYIRLMVLPEIGGRIHVGYDKISGYDFFYRQNVIKPALVGLAGPWVSGGVEFNWPQHHRPATFMPVETELECSDDGSVTAWCSDHDPMLRMKGMHGVCLRPGVAAVELRVRLYNRTPMTQTFLWWANVATRVHEQYQSFFPTDVHFVADHAKRAMTSFPLSDRPYYGVDYSARASQGVQADEAPSRFVPDGSYPANDLSWYANIPVPTSYMITGTEEDFFGGYDHGKNVGLVHVADHHIAPGKKQWTWGNHDFGYAWDRNLTDADGPYIELMAGVYTDNQPDFSFLAPWETKTFTQRWYPLRGTGVVQAATPEAALHLNVKGGKATLRVGVTRDLPDALVQLCSGENILQEWRMPLTVCELFERIVDIDPAASQPVPISAVVRASGRVVVCYGPAAIVPASAPAVAQEPETPARIGNVEELYLTGLHLQQYRHATRAPELYWREALQRDPGDSRCLNAMGLWHLGRGEIHAAAACFQKAIERLTRLNANPYDGEPFYSLGMALRLGGDGKKAYAAFYKATWNAVWRAAGYFALGEADAAAGHWDLAADHLERSLRAEADNLNARALLAYVYRRQGDTAKAQAATRAALDLDPLDIGARWAHGMAPQDGGQVLDLAFDLIRSGRTSEADTLLGTFAGGGADGTRLMILLALSDLRAGHGGDAARPLREAEATDPVYCFPSRLEEMLLLERTLQREPRLAVAHYLLGNYLYDRRRHHEAIVHWEAAATLQPEFATTWRNLGIAYFNVQSDTARALAAYDRAVALNPADGRVLYERDQLWKRTGKPPSDRLRSLREHMEAVHLRDDLSVEFATLLNQLHRPDEALHVLTSRQFQPWEGGEGLVLGQYVRSHLLLGKQSLQQHRAADALRRFQAALQPPPSLSEGKHLLANQSDVAFWTARAYEALGESGLARDWDTRAVEQKGDFQQMAVRDVSDMSVWSGLSLLHLGQTQEAHRLFQRILTFAETLQHTEPRIDYFATSLPRMLLFEDDLHKRRDIEVSFLRAQAHAGLGDLDAAETLLHQVLTQDVNHAGAEDLLAQLKSFAMEAH